MSRFFLSKVMTVKKSLHSPKKLILPAGQNGLLKWIPDEIYLKWVFNTELGYPLNIKNPTTYNEKLQWIKLFDRKKEYTTFADKYNVRKYIAETIGEQYLVPLIGVYESVDEIPWSILPEKFVLKCTHSSGSNIICDNKALLDIPNSVENLKYWMKKNAYWGGREWCYKQIVPRIICEEYIQTSDGLTPDDFKFMCFNGEPKLIQVHHDRYGEHTLDFMNCKWEKTGIVQGPPNSTTDIPKPENLDEMMHIARVLSKNMYYARIDLYNSNGKIFFGEITMYPTSGFSPFDSVDTDYLLGKWISLPTDK